jgi:hypothetical protein
MQGVNCLQDLKNKLTLAGFEIEKSEGWFVDSAHGRWTRALGVVYIDGQPCKNISDVPVKKKPTKKKLSGPVIKKIKSAKF